MSMFNVTKSFCLKDIMLGSRDESFLSTKFYLHSEYYIPKCNFKILHLAL